MHAIDRPISVRVCDRVQETDDPVAAPATPERLAMLRDGLARAQRELPESLLVGPDELRLAAAIRRLPGCGYDTVERALLDRLLPAIVSTARPATLVHLHPDASDAAAIVLAHLEREAIRVAYVAVGSRYAACAPAVARAAHGGAAVTATGVVADPALDIPVPSAFPRPRLLMCLGNALGRYSRIGAVRVLRVARGAMRPSDTLMLGLDLRNDVHALELAFNDTSDLIANYHKRVLAAASRELGADFDPDRFEFRAVYDMDSRRLEARLVARRAHEVRVPGLGTLPFRRGDSIRTAVSATFSRASVGAMLAGVGLALQEWMTDDAGSFAIATAVAAT